MPQNCSPLTSPPTIGLPLPPFSTPSTSADTPKATRFPSQGVEKGNSLSPGLAENMTDQLEKLLIAVARFTGKGGRGGALCSLLLHQLVLPLLGLWELSGDNHEAQIDHEEGTDLWETHTEMESAGECCWTIEMMFDILTTLKLVIKFTFTYSQVGSSWQFNPNFVLWIYLCLIWSDKYNCVVKICCGICELSKSKIISSKDLFIDIFIPTCNVLQHLQTLA